MRVYALSDIHIDYEVNRQWIKNISKFEYTNDILILAGDISHRIELLGEGLETLCRRFREVVFVPGNHDLWVSPSTTDQSIEKFRKVIDLARSIGVRVSTLELPNFRIVPLLSWYDLSFGPLTKELEKRWLDFHACRWPKALSFADITRLFLDKNDLSVGSKDKVTISLSHFLPRIDLMPPKIPLQHQIVYPVLGAKAIDEQVRAINSSIHVYGHSHVNRDVTIDGVRYINNAYANPKESRIARKEIFCIYKD